MLGTSINGNGLPDRLYIDIYILSNNIILVIQTKDEENVKTLSIVSINNIRSISDIFLIKMVMESGGVLDC